MADETYTISDDGCLLVERVEAKQERFKREDIEILIEQNNRREASLLSDLEKCRADKDILQNRLDQFPS